MITLASLRPFKIILQQYYRITKAVLQVYRLQITTVTTVTTTNHYRFHGKAPIFADVNVSKMDIFLMHRKVSLCQVNLSTTFIFLQHDCSSVSPSLTICVYMVPI